MTSILDGATIAPRHVEDDPARFARPGKLEWLVAGSTIFFLAFNVPTTWFQAVRFDGGVASASDPITQVAFLACFGVALVQVVPNLVLLFDIVRRSPHTAAFCVLALASFFWSSVPTLTLIDGAILALTTVFGLFLVVRFEPRQILGIIVVAFSVGVVVNWLFIVGLPRFGLGSDGNATGVLWDKNSLGRVAVFVFGHLLLGSRVFTRYRWPLRVLTLASFGLVVLSGSATSMASAIALAGMLGVFVFFRARRQLLGAVVAAMIAGAASGIAVLYVQLEFVTALLGKDVTLTGRTRLWALLIDDIAAKPMFGYGYHGFFTGWFGPVHETWIEFRGALPHAHNAGLTYLLELGLVGFVIMLLAFWRLTADGVRFVQRVPGPGGLWPLMVAAFTLMFSVTEVGIHGRTVYWAVFVAVSAIAAREIRRPPAAQLP